MEERPDNSKRDGFLPFYTNAFDRVFISAVILIGIHLLWLRFMEPALPIEVGDSDLCWRLVLSWCGAVEQLCPLYCSSLNSIPMYANWVSVRRLSRVNRILVSRKRSLLIQLDTIVRTDQRRTFWILQTR